MSGFTYLICAEVEVGDNGGTERNFFFVDIPFDHDKPHAEYIASAIKERFNNPLMWSYSVWSLVDRSFPIDDYV